MTAMLDDFSLLCEEEDCENYEKCVLSDENMGASNPKELFEPVLVCGFWMKNGQVNVECQSC